MIRDQDLPFFKPLWRRYLTVGFATLWATAEWTVWASPFWGMLASAMAIYGYWRLFLTFPNDL
jgi:hypothetical protein